MTISPIPLASIEPGDGGSNEIRLRRAVGEPVPLDLGRQTGLDAEPVDLLSGQQSRVILWTARYLEPVPLDRVGEDHRRPVRGFSRRRAPRTSPRS